MNKIKAPRRGRPELITDEMVLDALNRRLTLHGFADETGFLYDTCQKAVHRRGLKLSPTPRGRESVTELDIACELFKYVQNNTPHTQGRLAFLFGIQRQRVSAVAVKLKKRGVEL